VRRLAPVLLAVGLLLAGCASPGYRTEHLLVSDSVPSGAAAPAPSGSVEYNSHGCVSVGGSIVLVAPPGSRLIDDGIIIVGPTAAHADDRQLQVGEALPDDATGVRADRHSKSVPHDYDCGSDTYFVLG
jgi:hypothetical protein